MIRRAKIETYLNSVRAEAICLYGSFHFGSWREDESDVDLIVIVKKSGTRRHVTKMVDRVPINAAYVSLDVLEDDAINGTYGFLYISKFLNPHYFLKDPSNHKAYIWSLVSRYLEQYSFPEIFADARPLRIKEIIARIYLLHLSNFPHYAVKLLNTFPEKDFSHLEEQFTYFICASKFITSSGGEHSLSELTPPTYRPYFQEIVRMRWWQTFQDYRRRKHFLRTQIEKPRVDIDARQEEILSLINFLQQSARLNPADHGTIA